ncbi:MAG: glycosyltransferase family 9 protein [Candidatus Yonathbacteria bacterium]|nr:glycosyltransferase family 9 protein [Candidatus Yonathbacteria bacterium]
MFINGAIGDCLMGTLCADSVQKKLPESKIIIITPRNVSILQDLLSAYPHIQVVEINRYNFLSALFLLMSLVWQRNLVVYNGILKEASFFTQFLFRLLSIHIQSSRFFFLKDGMRGKERGGVLYFNYKLSVYQNLARLFSTQYLNIPSAVPLYHFVSDAGVLERHHLVRFTHVVVHPCASNPVRSLPPDRWVKIFKYLSNNFPNIKIVVTGSERDRRFIQEIFDAGVSPNSVIDLTGMITMTELANIIDRARGYLGVDTGITHLAGVLQKRSVIIGNLSNPHWLPYYNKNATILAENKNCTCDGQKGGDCFYWIGEGKYYKCLIDISEKTIHDSIRKMLA